MLSSFSNIPNKSDRGKDKSAPGYRHPHIAHHYPLGTMHGTSPQYHQLAASMKREVWMTEV